MTYNVRSRESRVERQDALDELDVLLGQRDAQSLDVSLEVLDLASADERKDVGHLLHHIRNSD